MISAALRNPTAAAGMIIIWNQAQYVAGARS